MILATDKSLSGNEVAKSYDDVSMSAFSKALAKVAGFMMVGFGVWAHSQSRRQHVDRPEMN